MNFRFVCELSSTCWFLMVIFVVGAQCAMTGDEGRCPFFQGRRFENGAEDAKKRIDPFVESDQTSSSFQPDRRSSRLTPERRSSRLKPDRAHSKKRSNQRITYVGCGELANRIDWDVTVQTPHVGQKTYCFQCVEYAKQMQNKPKVF